MRKIYESIRFSIFLSEEMTWYENKTPKEFTVTYIQVRLNPKEQSFLKGWINIYIRESKIKIADRFIDRDW